MTERVGVTERVVDEKKKRDAELLWVAQQRKNYAIVDFPGALNNSSTMHAKLNNNSAHFHH